MQEIIVKPKPLSSAVIFGGCLLLFFAAAAAAIGSFPLAASIVTIFAFAGVHNAMEFRYFLARMPVRWGRSRTYYLTGIGGVVLLTGAYLMIYFGSGTWLWDADTWEFLVPLWNTSLVVWVAVLLWLRGRQHKGRDMSWAFPAALFAASLAWFVPPYWSLALVYLHPFVAMWFLERQLRRTRPDWVRTYRLCLATIPLFIAALYISFASVTPLPETSGLDAVITAHAGSNLITGVSSHFLVATHVFLETIHYFVWILLLPLIDRRARPWRIADIPLAGSAGSRAAVVVALVISAGLLIALWSGFSIDYQTTRDIYFAFAIGHVLAELPFLVKML